MGYLSGKKMEGDECLNTVECLRARLLAERQVSRVAKEEAESIGNKLVELENKLREEIKLRERAERKLKFFKKKLESFNVYSISGESEQSFLSAKREKSWKSLTSSSISRDPEENETKPRITNPPLSENSVHKVSEFSAPIHAHSGPSECNLYPYYDFLQHLWENPNPNFENLKNEESRLSSSSRKSSTKNYIAEGTDDYCSNTNPCDSFPEDLSHYPNPSSTDVKNDKSRPSVRSENEDASDGDFVDNSLALVPVNLPTTLSEASYLNPVNESVIEVLDALRIAREKLLGSMGAMQMIKVGPT